MTENSLYDLDYGLLKVSGADAKKLLQGQLTCDVENIKTPTFGAHCNPQGRIISLFYLFYLKDAYYLLLPRTMMTIAMQALKKYAVFYKVILADASDSLVISGYQGDGIEDNSTTVYIKIPSSTPRYILVKNASPKNVTKTMKDWQYLDIKDGIPAIYPETSGKFLPHELNLHELNGINFDKGCYTGQEIIARMHYRGKLKTRLYQTKVEGTTPPLLGSDITFLPEGESLPLSGMVVDICPLAYNQHYALIVARK